MSIFFVHSLNSFDGFRMRRSRLGISIVFISLVLFHLQFRSKMQHKYVHPLVLVTDAAKRGDIALVRSIIDSRPDGLRINYVMMYAARGGHLNIMDLCIRKGATDFEFSMRNARDMKVIRYVVEKQRASKKASDRIENLESPLYYLIAEDDMKFANQILEFAKENNVTLNWDLIVGCSIFKKNLKGVKFCIENGRGTKWGDHTIEKANEMCQNLGIPNIPFE